MASGEKGAGAQRRPVRTAPARSAGARALKARGIGLAWGEGAPIPVALRADSHCTCCGSTQAFPRTLAHDDVWTTPPHPRPRQEREARVAPSVSSSAKRTTSLTSPPSPGDNVRNRGSTCGRSGVQRLRLWCRARSARPRPGCRIGAQAPGAARHLGAERVARGGDGSQRLCRPAHRRAAPSARSAVRRAPSA